jgi:hypothetical protein
MTSYHVIVSHGWVGPRLTDYLDLRYAPRRRACSPRRELA